MSSSSRSLSSWSFLNLAIYTDTTWSAALSVSPSSSGLLLPCQLFYKFVQSRLHVWSRFWFQTHLRTRKRHWILSRLVLLILHRDVFVLMQFRLELWFLPRLRSKNWIPTSRYISHSRPHVGRGWMTYPCDDTSLEFTPDSDVTSFNQLVYEEHIRDFSRDQIDKLIIQLEDTHSSYSLKKPDLYHEKSHLFCPTFQPDRYSDNSQKAIWIRTQDFIRGEDMCCIYFCRWRWK